MRTIRVLLVIMILLHLWEVLAILHVNDGVVNVTNRFNAMRTIIARLWISDAKKQILYMKAETLLNRMYQ